jgi:hypothetical protein
MFGLLHFCMWNHTTCDPGKGDPFQATAFCSAETSGRLVFFMAGYRARSQQPVLMSSSVERFEIGAWNGTCIAQRRRMGDTSQVLLKASRSVKSQMFPNSGLFVVNWEWEKCSQVCKLLAVVSHFYRFYHFSCFVLPWRVQHFRKKNCVVVTLDIYTQHDAFVAILKDMWWIGFFSFGHAVRRCKFFLLDGLYSLRQKLAVSGAFG